MAALPIATIQGALGRLLAEHVVQPLLDGYGFVSDDMRAAVYEAMPDTARARLHRALGHMLDASASDDRLAQVRAAVHLLYAGEWACASRSIRRSVQAFLYVETAVALLRALS